jgi:hypothetical protein
MVDRKSTLPHQIVERDARRSKPDLRDDDFEETTRSRSEKRLTEELRARAERIRELEAMAARQPEHVVDEAPGIPPSAAGAFKRGAEAGQKFWWVVGAVMGVGAIGGAGAIGGRVVQDSPRPAKEAVVGDVIERVKKLEDWRVEEARWLRADYADRAAKERSLLAWACARGFRADNVDCEAIATEVDADDALSRAADRAKVAPIWRTRVEWPNPRKPPQ